ncbi:aspartate/glutamate racemase family protein [Oceanimonas sp. CAM02]|uniref:aspartate/glutamate racemase family protein n=1 Tax=Oceanimonas sp. CAM02 TaxID=3080336 RepID=UPI002936D461|nr:aspartate/glutamate racemase family protein [Oceanimonas sp. CAM02]MDV2858785.1 aspartate/glutamate racemase family protein [Oceanimonas sp. CAM02]
MPEVAKTLMLINPNSSESATAAMVALAGQVAGGGVQVQGLTNTGVPALLTTPAEIRAATAGVIELGVAAAAEGAAALMVAAFSDPGLQALRQRVKVPVVGIAESAYLAAACEGRRFAIATITPDADLLAFFNQKARSLGLEQQFCGTRVTAGDPAELVAMPDALDDALSEAVRLAVLQDGADAVIIGGGPLTGSALRLQPHFDVPLVVPVLAATRAALAAIDNGYF